VHRGSESCAFDSRRFIPSVRTTPGYSLEGVGLPPIQLYVMYVIADTGAVNLAAGALVHLIQPFQRVNDCGSLSCESIDGATTFVAFLCAFMGVGAQPVNKFMLGFVCFLLLYLICQNTNGVWQ